MKQEEVWTSTPPYKKVRQQLDNLRSQISFSAVLETKLELEFVKLLSLEEDY